MSGERRYPDGTCEQAPWRYKGTRAEWHGEQDKILMSAMLKALEHPEYLTVNILRMWPRAQVVSFAKHLLGDTCQACGEHEEPKPVIKDMFEFDSDVWANEPEECPDCKQKSVKCAPGGGVKCSTPGCGYWFCF